jgi:hypothetical protein
MQVIRAVTRYFTPRQLPSYQCVAGLSNVDAKLIWHSLTAVAAHRNHAAHRKPLNTSEGTNEKN